MFWFTILTHREGQIHCPPAFQINTQWIDFWWCWDKEKHSRHTCARRKTYEMSMWNWGPGGKAWKRPVSHRKPRSTFSLGSTEAGGPGLYWMYSRAWLMELVTGKNLRSESSSVAWVYGVSHSNLQEQMEEAGERRRLLRLEDGSVGTQ